MNLELTIEEPAGLCSKCQDDKLYTLGLRSLYRESNFIIITKDKMQEGVYDDNSLKFLFQLKPVSVKGTPAVVKKFAELVEKDEDR